jgi:hypothetical protein
MVGNRPVTLETDLKFVNCVALQRWRLGNIGTVHANENGAIGKHVTDAVDAPTSL